MLILLVTKKLNEIVTELSIRGRKLNISTVFITQSYFALLKDVILNCTHVFIMKSQKKNKRFKKSHLIIHQTLTLKTIHKNYAASSYSNLVFDTTLVSDNPLGFRKSLL